ncbi:MAG: hypothetical protein JWM74_3421, partial [Myxococcaceae bacterium]|nr:hypothetical protein [Myxococcaceae bacterium]
MGVRRKKARLVPLVWLAASLTIAIGTTGTTAFADDEPSAADRAAARELGTEGVMLANKGKCADAIEKLERADKLYHAPTTLGRLGECQIDVGQIVKGSENLQRVVREALPPNAPKAFVTAKERAAAALKKAVPRIAKLRIVVIAPPDADFEVKVDKETMSQAALDTPRPTDPGNHVIEASGEGLLPAETKVTLKEGDMQNITLKLEVDPNAPKPPPAVAQKGPKSNAPRERRPDEEPPPETGGSKAGAYIVLGLGIAGLAVGSVTGAMALSRKSDIDGRCPNKNDCPESVRSDLDTAKTFGLISTVGFIAGGVGVVGGVVLLLTSGSSPTPKAQLGSVSPSTSPSWKPAPTPHLTARPVLGIGYAGLSGSF